MSYHETYEFFAIDRRLTPAEMRALRAISTRATITPTRFYNFYDWGGLKADPRVLLQRYFDLFVYTGSGGARWGMLRFPADRVDRREWRAYVAEQRGESLPDRCASLATRGATTILTVLPPEISGLTVAARRASDDGEDDGWEDENFGDEEVDEGSLAVPLAVMRADLLAGDLRALYLLWLSSVQGGERRVTTPEPPRPPGLAHLTGTLHALAEFIRLDADLLTVALDDPPAAGRTAGSLLEAARSRGAARRRTVAHRAAAERARRLAALEHRQDDEWLEIDRLVGEKKTKAYDDAVRRLAALRELSVARDTEATFRARLQALLDRHRSKYGFRERVRSARLLPA